MNKCNSHNRKHTGMFVSDKTKAKNLKLENVVQQGNGALFGVNFSKKLKSIIDCLNVNCVWFTFTLFWNICEYKER